MERGTQEVCHDVARTGGQPADLGAAVKRFTTSSCRPQDERARAMGS